MRRCLVFAILALGASPAAAQYYGNLSGNRSLPPSYGAPPPMGYANPYGTSGNSPGLYDNHGGFHGNLNGNRYDPNSVANPYGQYGNPYSPDSVNNPYGQYGNPYAVESPRNPYGQGLRVCGVAGCD